MHLQSATKNIDLVGEVVAFLRDMLDAMPLSIAYVRDASALSAFLVRSNVHTRVFGKEARERDVNGLKLIAWYAYSPTDLKQFALQFTLLSQTMETLAEFVQGPCDENQMVLADQHACESIMTVLEWLLALQLTGRAREDAQEWDGHGGRALCERLELALPEGSGERDEVAKWLKKFEKPEWRDEWATREAEMFSAAKKMERSLLVMLSSMLEGDAEPEVAEHLVESLEPSGLLGLLNLHWQRYFTRRKSRARARKSKRSQEDIEEGSMAFLYYSLGKLLTEDSVEAAKAVPLRKAMQRWEERDGKEILAAVRRIEIVDDDGKVGRLYFQMPEYVESVWASNDVEEFKQEIIFTVKRDNPEEKLKDFWYKTDDLVALLQHTHRIQMWRRLGGFRGFVGFLAGWLAQSHIILNRVSIAASMVIAFWMVLPTNKEGGFTGDLQYPADVASEWIVAGGAGSYRNYEKGRVIFGLAIVLLCSTTFEVLSHIIAHVTLDVAREVREMRQRGGIKMIRPWGRHRKTISTDASSRFVDKLYAYNDGEEVVVQPFAFFYALYLIFSNAVNLKYLTFWSCAILSVAHTPAWSCINLLAVAERTPSMLYVFAVLRQNFRQMVTTLFLAFIIIYIFSVLSFTAPALRGKYQIIDHAPGFSSSDDNDIGDLHGDTNLLLYTLFHLDYGFREGPMFEHSFSAYNSMDQSVDYGSVFVGFFFDLFYYIIVLLIFTAIVSGIIIDSFAELRVKNQEIRDDIHNTCFVCDIDREDFEQLGLNFKAHLQNDHNMWDYMFFKLYLEEKDPTDFTGLETYCWELIQQNKITWFPIKKAIIIEGRNKEKKDVPGLYRRLGGLEGKVAPIKAELRHLREVQEEQKATVKEVRDEIAAVGRALEGLRDALQGSGSRRPSVAERQAEAMRRASAQAEGGR